MTGCLFCPYTYDDTQPGLYIDHLQAHVRDYRARRAYMEGLVRDTGNALVSLGRELLAVAS